MPRVKTSGACISATIVLPLSSVKTPLPPLVSMTTAVLLLSVVKLPKLSLVDVAIRIPVVRPESETLPSVLMLEKISVVTAEPTSSE